MYLCLTMYCISTNLPGPPRHVNHRGEDYYKSATSYSTYVPRQQLKATPTKRQRLQAPERLGPRRRHLIRQVTPKPTGPFDTKKAKWRRLSRVLRYVRTYSVNVQAVVRHCDCRLSTSEQ